MTPVTCDSPSLRANPFFTAGAKRADVGFFLPWVLHLRHRRILRSYHEHDVATSTGTQKPTDS